MHEKIDHQGKAEGPAEEQCSPIMVDHHIEHSKALYHLQIGSKQIPSFQEDAVPNTQQDLPGWQSRLGSRPLRTQGAPAVAKGRNLLMHHLGTDNPKMNATLHTDE